MTGMATTLHQQADSEHFLQRRCSDVTPRSSDLHASKQVENHSFSDKAPGNRTVDFSGFDVTFEATSKSTHPHWRSPHSCDMHIDQVGSTETASDVAPPCTPLLLVSRQKYVTATSTPGSSHSFPFLSLSIGLSDNEKKQEGKTSSFCQMPYGTSDECFTPPKTTQITPAPFKDFSQLHMEGQTFGHLPFKDNYCYLSLSRHEEQTEYPNQTFSFSHYSGHPLSHRVFASPGLSKELPDTPKLNQHDGVSDGEWCPANQAVGLRVVTCGNYLKVANVGTGRPTCVDDDVVWPKNMKFMQLLTGGLDHLNDEGGKGRSDLDDDLNKDLSMADGFGFKYGSGDRSSYLEMLSSNCNQDEQESGDCSKRVVTCAFPYSTAQGFPSIANSTTMAASMNPAHAQMPKVLTTFSGGDPSLPLAVGLSGSSTSDAALGTLNLCLAEDAGWGKFLALSETTTRKAVQAHVLPFQLRFKKLQAFLRQRDESDANDCIQVLRMLTAAEKCKHAAELESRARHLALEEGREMKRMKLLNVLGRGSRTVEGTSGLAKVEHRT